MWRRLRRGHNGEYRSIRFVHTLLVEEFCRKQICPQRGGARAPSCISSSETSGCCNSEVLSYQHRARRRTTRISQRNISFREFEDIETFLTNRQKCQTPVTYDYEESPCSFEWFLPSLYQQYLWFRLPRYHDAVCCNCRSWIFICVCHILKVYLLTPYSCIIRYHSLVLSKTASAGR